MMYPGFSSLMALILMADPSRSGLVIMPPFTVQSSALVDNQGQPIIPADISNKVPFTSCTADDYPVYGNVESMTITPCQRSNLNDPCTFVKGNNYTVQVIFQTSLSSDNPRSSVVAADPEGNYAYSGQSFNGCKYASCPVYANQRSAYTYHFHTLASSFCHLSFNLTQGIYGPSIFCASTPVIFRK